MSGCRKVRVTRVRDKRCRGEDERFGSSGPGKKNQQFNKPVQGPGACLGTSQTTGDRLTWKKEGLWCPGNAEIESLWENRVHKGKRAGKIFPRGKSVSNERRKEVEWYLERLSQQKLVKKGGLCKSNCKSERLRNEIICEPATPFKTEISGDDHWERCGTPTTRLPGNERFWFPYWKKTRH